MSTIKTITDADSPAEAAIRRRTRRAWEFDISEFLQRGSAVSGKFRMRVADTEEQSLALIGADKYVRDLLKASSEAITGDVLPNAKIAYLMHAVCLHPEKDRPAYHSGRFLAENLTPDELAALLNAYHECLRLSGPLDLDLDDEKLEGLASVLAATAATDAPNIALIPFTQSQLAEIAIRLSLKLRAARDELAAMTESATADTQAATVAT